MHTAILHLEHLKHLWIYLIVAWTFISAIVGLIVGLHKRNVKKGLLWFGGMLLIGVFIFIAFLGPISLGRDDEEKPKTTA